MNIHEFKIIGGLNEIILSKIYNCLQKPGDNIKNDKKETSRSHNSDSNALFSSYEFNKNMCLKIRTFIYNDDFSVTHHDEIFSFICLNRNQGNIYKALDLYFKKNFEENIENTGNFLINKQEKYIINLPNIIFFEIVNFHSENFYNFINPVNKNKCFSFDKIIYLDKYLFSNKNKWEMQKINFCKICKLKDEIKVLIKKYKNYYKDLFNLPEILEITKSFLSLQLDKDDSESSLSEKASPICDPDQIGLMGYPSEDIISSIKVIESYSSNILKYLKELMLKKVSLNNEIKGLNFIEKSSPFFLHSIIIKYSGRKIGSYYYCFIYDSIENKWLKFNETHFDEVKEELVLEESFGKKKGKSACFLCYVSDKSFLSKNNHLQEIQNNHNILNTQIVLTSIYEKIIPKDLLAEILSDNKKNCSAFANNKVLKNVNDVITYYKQRMELINKLINDESLSIYRPFNFSCFLKIKGHDNLCRWVILNELIISFCGSEYCLLTHPQNESFHKGLKDLLFNKEIQGPKSFYLKDKELLLLAKLKEEYEKEIIKAIVCSYIFQKLLEENWISSIGCLNYLISSNEIEIDNMSTILGYLFSLGILRLSSEVNKNVMELKWENTLTILEMITFLCSNLNEEEQIFAEYSYKILNDTFLNIKNLIPKDFSDSWKESISSIKNCQELNITNSQINNFTEIKSQITSIRKDSLLFNFTNGWEDGPFFNMDELKKKLAERMKIWIEWFFIINNEEELTIEKIHNDEESIGINVSKIIQNK